MTKVKNTELAQCKHPNSRKTNALAKQLKKTKSREKSRQASNIKLNLLGEKLLWFQENLDSNSSSYTSEQTLKIIEKYLSRFDEELAQIKLKHSIGGRKNRQHASREDIINLTIKREREEFNSSGLEIPDLLCISQFALLKQWNGELRLLPNFRLKKYNRGQLEANVQKESKQGMCQSVKTDCLMQTN